MNTKPRNVFVLNAQGQTSEKNVTATQLIVPVILSGFKTSGETKKVYKWLHAIQKDKQPSEIGLALT